ncbi:hypothetical protein DSO57_1034217 [Entomophthora muscae]|uniref:Uncharacterized protein n=1 Tax=Entomophthora muscae TaxID=34485 RepID=A0ACC2TYK6_9FUNG|nr:hypothetical protein DSO57_1034217 [Entomophthora muscae]
MRFVVFLDLLSTVIMPATLGYLIYLMYRLISDRDKTIGLVSLFFITIPYVLQMIVFLIRRQWQHIGWMIIYLMALPAFAFFIPVYSFWHFDDFSWGNTRVVLGEGGKKKKVAAEEGHFDPRSIPTRRWSEYEEEAWEAATEKTQVSDSSAISSINRQIHNISPAPFAPPPPLMDPGVYYSAMNQPDFRSVSQMSFNPPTMAMPPVYPMYPPPSRAQSPAPRRPRIEIPTLDTYNPPPNFPPPADIIEAIRAILGSSDLMSLSKKQVRQSLSAHYSLSFDPYKEQINTWIELILQGQV